MSLKTPTEAEKKFLALFDEPTPTRSNDTKTNKEHKERFEKSFGYKTPTADIAAKIEAAERIVWIPFSYVLFSRQTTCKACGAVEKGMDSPRLFLQQRKQRKDESNPYIYTPVSSIEHWNLPRRIILNIATSVYCLKCFEGAKACSNSLNSNQGDIASPIEEFKHHQNNVVLQMGQLVDLSEAASLFSSPFSSPANTSPGASAGLPSETDFGSVCGEREFAQHATVED